MLILTFLLWVALILNIAGWWQCRRHIHEIELIRSQMISDRFSAEREFRERVRAKAHPLVQALVIVTSIEHDAGQPEKSWQEWQQSIADARVALAKWQDAL